MTPVPMLILRPMSETVYLDYLQASIQSYADEGVQSGNWSAEEALEKSQAQFGALLPQALATPDHFFFELVDAELDQRVGQLWVALRGKQERRELFIYEIVVEANFQGRGYGSQAIELIKPLALDHGAHSLGLHVFGHNRSAVRLYERLGFEATNINMRLNLVP